MWIHHARRVAAMACGVASLAVATLGTAWAAEKPIKIGSTLSVTGPASFLGDPELKTLQIYINQLNKGGGLLGRKIELIHYDDSGDAEKGRTFTKRLIEEDKVDVIIGGSLTGVTMPMIPLVEKAEMPFVSLAAAEAIVIPPKKWVFKTAHTDRMSGAKVLEDMKKRGITKIALISSSSALGVSGRTVSKEEAPNYGIEIIADEVYSPKDVDMTPQLTKIRNTAGVQAVLCFDFGQGPAIVTKNFKQLGMTVPLYQTHGVASQKYIELSGEAGEGVRLSASAMSVADDLPKNDPQYLVTNDYKKTFEAATKQDASFFGGQAYDALQIVLSAIARAGTTDKAKVRDEIEKTRGYIGTNGIVHMSPTDHLGHNLSSMRMMEIRGGKFRLIP